jgi:hypothetical protein
LGFLLKRKFCFNAPEVRPLIEKSRAQKTAARFNSRFKFRTKLLIAGILGGATAIAFPAAFTVVVVYVGVALGAVGMMAWIGMMALASAAVAALLLPVLTVLTVVAAVAGVRRLMRMFSPRGDVEAVSEQQVSSGGPGSRERPDVFQEGLDDWETDGGPAAPPRKKVAWRRAGRSHPPPDRQPSVVPSEGGRALLLPANQHDGR